MFESKDNTLAFLFLREVLCYPTNIGLTHFDNHKIEDLVQCSEMSLII